MRRVAIGIAVAVLVLAVGTQLLAPLWYESRVESRLTERGGEADVGVTAFPAVTLVDGKGSRLEIEGREIDLPLDEREEVFRRLDGFDEVHVDLRDFRAGPFETAFFLVDRPSRDEPYRVRMRASASGEEVADFAEERLEGPLGGAAARLAAAAIRAAARAAPVELDLVLRSENGDPEVVSGRGTVAGIDAGPLTELLAASVLAEL
jgi:hypothetical protein